MSEMNDEEFEDLFGGGVVSEGSSQESLTRAAADLAFWEGDEGGTQHDRQASPATSVGSEDGPSTVKILRRGTASAAHVGNPQDERTRPPPSALSRTHSRELQTSSVIDKIDDVFEQIADGMLSEQNEISIMLKARVQKKPVVLRILELTHEALRTGVTLSKRDIYYRDPALFGSQAHVDRYVDDIAFTFGVPRSALNVAAVAKGLVAGAITFCRRDGSVVNAAADKDGILVPSLKEVLSIDMTAVRWIIVVEKEASFRSIASSSFWEKVSTDGVLITGKGYPDIASRALLRYLSTPSPQNGFATPPVYGLADFDPDGLAILSTYKHGSIALAHESAELRVPQLKWLGLRSEHMLLGGDSTHASQGLLTLTARDRGKARKMLDRSVHPNDDDAETEYGRELQVMLMLNMKAELQLLDAVPNGMTDLLDSELGRLRE
ncbi:hypothetical protein LTR85_007199 [Meristemomyces frigidus]|nr:hypothetical protein LTR85_007199 [Meristemomyces frigidus]